MHAMVYPEPYRVRVENEAIRKVEHRNDAIVRVTRAATRGSDLPLRHGMMPGTRAGMTFSQQFIREVHSIGPAVQSLPVGIE
jgi:alcohol dehydrogenase